MLVNLILGISVIIVVMVGFYKLMEYLGLE